VLRAVVSYERDRIFHSSRLIVPILLYLIYFVAAYSYAPLNILSSYGICSLVVYMLMLSVGVMNDDLSCPMIDQTILVKMRRKSYFYIGKTLMLAIISLALSLFSALVPLVIDAARGGALFNRGVVLSDVLSGIALFWLIGLNGGITGLFANQRVIAGRKAAVVVSILLGVLVIIKGPVVKAAPAAGYIAWIFPPVYDLATAYGRDAYFNLGGTLVFFLWLAAYTVLEAAAYVGVMLKRKFE
jgi:hypothetical protein